MGAFDESALSFDYVYFYLQWGPFKLKLHLSAFLCDLPHLPRWLMQPQQVIFYLCLQCLALIIVLLSLFLPLFPLLQLSVFIPQFLFLLLKFCSMSYLISTLSISLIIVINDHIQAVLNIEVKWFQIAIWLMIIRYHLTLSMMLLIDYIIISSVCLFSAFFRY